MLTNLRTRLTISYIILVLVCVMVITLLANYFLEQQFRNYVMGKHDQQNLELARTISGYYLGSQAWDANAIERAGMNALHDGLIIKVLDISNDTVWDATEHNLGMCVHMLETIEQNMQSRYPNWRGEYQEDTYPLVYGTGQIGQLIIGYHGPFFYSDHDLDFISTLNRLLLGSAVLLLLAALALGYFMSSRISRPISQVVKLSEKIANGDYRQKITSQTSDKELMQLTESINRLAYTLDQQETRKRQLTADIAHELRTPLSTLQSHIEAMLDGVWQPDTARLSGLHQEITRITGLVSDLETLTRLENESVQLDRQSFDLTEHVRHLVRIWEDDRTAVLRRIIVLGESLDISADKDKISQIMGNLLMNALAYAEEGNITVEIFTDGDSAVIKVHDDGPGINAEDLPFIFDRFYRADKSRNRKTGGSGLGLAITKALVNAHGGTISVESVTGQGTDFIVRLPVNPR